VTPTPSIPSPAAAALQALSRSSLLRAGQGEPGEDRQEVRGSGHRRPQRATGVQGEGQCTWRAGVWARLGQSFVEIVRYLNEMGLRARNPFLCPLKQSLRV